MGALGGATPKWFPLSNSRMPRAINLKFGVWISLGEGMAVIEHAHQGAPYGGGL